MIVLIDGVRYRLVIPDNEAALEEAIKSNFQHIFGPDSFYFDIKSKIKSKAGVVSIPDGYVIFFTPKKARWAIIEVELASHSIYNHVIPQLSKFNSGIEDSSARRKLVDVLYDLFDDDEVLKARLKQKIKSGEVHKFISDLVSENPLIVVAIDQRTEELDEALRHIGGEVQVVEFKTFRREGLSDDVNAFVFEPVLKSIIYTGNGTNCKERGTDKFGSRLGSNQAKINSEPIVTSLTALRLAYLKELSPKVKQEHIKLLIEIDKTHKYIFEVDWNHPGKELLVFGKSGIRCKPANAVKELFGKDFLGSYGNIARKNGVFVDTSTSTVQIIAHYADVEKHITHLKKAGVIAATTEVDISVSHKSGTVFNSITPHKQKVIIGNILQRRQLWDVFLKRKKMTSGEFKKHSKFKPKAITGFIMFLTRNKIATEFADTFTLNEAVIPQIKELLNKY